MHCTEEENFDSHICLGEGAGSPADSAYGVSEPGDSLCACVRRRHGQRYQQDVRAESYLSEKCTGKADFERK